MWRVSTQHESPAPIVRRSSNRVPEQRAVRSSEERAQRWGHSLPGLFSAVPQRLPVIQRGLLRLLMVGAGLLALVGPADGQGTLHGALSSPPSGGGEDEAAVVSGLPTPNSTRKGDYHAPVPAGADANSFFAIDPTSFQTTVLMSDELVTERSECEPHWLRAFGEAMPGMNTRVRAFATFDDGNGPALYAGGDFTIAGDVEALRIAKWDGSAWHSVGGGVDGSVWALAVHDDGSGSGPALYVGGDFAMTGDIEASGIARWDGANWSSLGDGVNYGVRALTTFDDGSGGGHALYVGGFLTSAGGVDAPYIARWDGESWSNVGDGTNAVVYALTVFDDGHGPSLYVGGDFTVAGDIEASYIARWDGESWSPVGGGASGRVRALTVYEDLRGDSALYVGGYFAWAGNVAKWDGVEWSFLADGVNGPVYASAVFDDGVGAGPDLFVAGSFSKAGEVLAEKIARWDPLTETWSPVGAGLKFGNFPTHVLRVDALAVHDDGSGNGPELFAGGFFTLADNTPADFISKWNGDSWSSPKWLDQRVFASAVYDDGSGNGPDLYVGGLFTYAHGKEAHHIARWNGETWSTLGGGTNGLVYALTDYDDGNGSALYAAGSFTEAGGVPAHRVAKWDGASWSPLGNGVNGLVEALAVFDDGIGDGPVLYAGGKFTEASGTAAYHIARWDGQSWSPVGGGTDGAVHSMTVFDDGGGNGPALYVTGSFTRAGNMPADNIARWDGQTWSPVGGGTDGVVYSVTIFDDGSGSGPALYVGGSFTQAGDVPVNNIARWDGTSWSALGSGIDGAVFALTEYHDSAGFGPSLYAGGAFAEAGGAPAHNIARWNGETWQGLGGEWDKHIRVLIEFDDGQSDAPALYVGGNFEISPTGEPFLTRWQGCPTKKVGDLNGDGVVDEQDLAILLAAWGPCNDCDSPEDCPADLNDDCIVDGADLGILLANWG